MKLHLLFPCLVALTVLSTCKKDPCPEEGEPCPCVGDACIEEMKEWFYFEPGTYWIYQEENSGDLDTVHVYEATESSSSFLMRTQSSVLEEWIPGDWVKYNYSYRFTSINSLDCRYNPHCDCNILERIKGRPLDFVAATNMLLFPFLEGEQVFVGGGGASRFESFIDTLNLPVGELYDIASVYHDTDITEHDRDVIYRIGQNQGIVQRLYPNDNETWNLIEYNIIQ